MTEIFSNYVTLAVLEISKELKVKTAVFKELIDACLLKEFINQRDEDEIKDFSKLFNVLKERDIIEPGKLQPMFDLLEMVKRNDLQKKLMHAAEETNDGHQMQQDRQPPQTRQQQPPQTRNQVYLNSEPPIAPNVVMAPEEDIMGEDLSLYFDKLVEFIGRDWRSLGRQLKLKKFDFEDISEQHPRHLRNQIREMLDLWKERNRKNATKAVLVSALRKCKLNLAADNLENMNVTDQ